MIESFLSAIRASIHDVFLESTNRPVLDETSVALLSTACAFLCQLPIGQPIGQPLRGVSFAHGKTLIPGPTVGTEMIDMIDVATDFVLGVTRCCSESQDEGGGGDCGGCIR